MNSPAENDDTGGGAKLPARHIARRIAVFTLALALTVGTGYGYLRFTARGAEFWFWQQCMIGTAHEDIKLLAEQQKPCAAKAQDTTKLYNSSYYDETRTSVMEEACVQKDAYLLRAAGTDRDTLRLAIRAVCREHAEQEMWNLRHPALYRFDEITTCTFNPEVTNHGIDCRQNYVELERLRYEDDIRVTERELEIINRKYHLSQ